MREGAGEGKDYFTSDEIVIDCVFHELSALLHLQLLPDVSPVTFNGVDTNGQDAGDVFARLPFGKKPQHLLFTDRERIFSSFTVIFQHLYQCRRKAG
jgi:hypothetical protein